MSCPGFNITANCTDPGYPIKFDADPDVAGIGVIVAFLISAWATFLFVIITFFFVESFDGTSNGFDSRVVQITREIRKFIRPLLPPLLKTDRPFSFNAIEKIAFTLSDQQLITGISIFIVGFTRHCVITQYHFYVVYLLGLLSFTTHQSTMIVVSMKLRKHHWMRWWRLAGIFLIFVFSLTANIPVYNWHFLAELGLVMQCVWSQFPDYYTPQNIGLMTLTSIFLVWGFVAVVGDICPEVDNLLGKLLAPIGRLLGPSLQFFSLRRLHYLTRKRLSEAQKTHNYETVWWLLNWTSFLLFLIYFTITQVMGSRIFDLYRIWIILYYATVELVSVRRQAANGLTADGSPALNGNENTWGFGQILPLLLLALPVSQAWEMVWEDIDDRRKEAERPSTAQGKYMTTDPPQAESKAIVDASATGLTAPGNGDTQENPPLSSSKAITTMTDAPKSCKQPPSGQRHDQEQPKTIERVDTVRLERGGRPAITQLASARSSVSAVADEFEVEKELYSYGWFRFWLLAWVGALTLATTYSTGTQGFTI